MAAVPPSLHALALVERGTHGAVVLQAADDRMAEGFGRVLYVNRRFAGWLGQSPKGLLGEALVQRIPDARRDHFCSVVEKGVATGAWPTRFVQPFRHGEGQTVFLNLHMTGDDLLAGSDGKPRQLLVLAEPVESMEGDFPVLQQRERELQQKALELKTAQKTLQGVLLTLAGPVRNYVASGASLARTLRQRLKALQPGEPAELAAHLLAAAESAEKLLADMIVHKQFQTGQTRLAPLLVDLEDMVEDVLAAERALCEAKQQKLRLDVPDASVTFRADPKAMRVVLLNLVSNARKFTPKGGTITVEGRVDGQVVVVDVRDTGTGISPEAIPSLFDMSCPTTQTGTDGEGGTGFGLLIANEIIAAHGGALLVESTPGKGSVFTIRLPMSPTR